MRKMPPNPIASPCHDEFLHVPGASAGHQAPAGRAASAGAGVRGAQQVAEGGQSQRPPRRSGEAGGAQQSSLDGGKQPGRARGGEAGCLGGI